MTKPDFSEYTHLFWDLDGTLTDSAPGIINCVRYALESFGINETDDSRLLLFVGPPLVESFMNFYGFSEEKARKAMARYRERFGTVGIFENSVYEDIPRVLKALKESGKKLYIATAKPEIYMFRIIKHFNLEQYFEFSAGSDLEETRSHKDQVIDFVVKSQHLEEELKAGKILMIGDRKHDIEGAQKNSMKCCAVNWGYGSAEEFKAYGADIVIDKPSDLLV